MLLLGSEEGAIGRNGPGSRLLIPRVDAIGEVPFDAVVNPKQAESALGHAQATEFDDEMLNMIDLDLRAKKNLCITSKCTQMTSIMNACVGFSCPM